VPAAPSPSPVVPPLLTTKLYAPRWRPGQVSRPRLVRRIARGTQSRLTLVSAPPGFGKSTLVAEWLESAPSARESVGWVSLDANDNDPATFWAYLVRALRIARPGVGQSALAMLDAPSPPPADVLLAVLLNEIAASAGEIVVVLDDYHVIENAAIHDGMAFLIDNMPPRMHVVIASRADPPLPLARLRARGELAEVRARDLRFTPEEAAAFLNGEMGLELAPESVAALEARTEGWIAALQLAALSMQGRDDARDFIGAFAGDDRYIVDYLVEEVLQRQPPPVREFLLQTAILDRLTASLCDAVTARDGGRAMLEALDRANLFIVPLDDKRQWFRYHHLFADVLRAHLHEENPDELPVLHTRASAWFAAENLRVPAIRHALAANDFERAALLVELESQAYALNHQPARLLEWLALLPERVVRSMPVLCANAGIALQGMGDLEGSRARLDDAERLLAGPESALVVADRAALDSVPTRIANGRGFLAIAAGDIEATVRHAHDALALAAEDDFHWRGTAASLLAMAHWKRGDLDAAQPYHAQGLASLERAGDFGLAVMSAFHDADLLKARGRLFEARAMLERSLELSARFGDGARLSIANLHLGLSELCCDQGDLAGAGQQLRLAEEKGIYEPRTPYRHALTRARLQQCRGDFAGALALLDDAERLRIRGAVPDMRPVDAWKARLWIACGAPEKALAWAETQGLSPSDELAYGREYHHLTLARALIAGHRPGSGPACLPQAVDLLSRLRSAAEAGGRRGAVLEADILQAIAHRALGDDATALAHLERALVMARPEGYVSIFRDEGPPMRDLLRSAVAAGIGGAYAGLATFDAPSPAPAPPPASSSLLEPLTPRELEILRLIAAGMQNQDIADHLVISLATVKRHIANAYGKLDVTHRTAAVARLNELHLL